MSLVLLTEPIIPAGTLKNCSFNAVNNKIAFEFQRKDFLRGTDFTMVNSGGYLGLDFGTASACVAGDIVYLYSTVYTSGFYTVLSNSATIVTLDTSYISSGAAGDFANINADRENYYIMLRITVDSVNYDVRASVQNTGFCRIDVSGVLRRLIEISDNLTHTFSGLVQSAYKDNDIVETFNVRYIEKYTGSTDSGTYISRDYFACLAAMSIGEYSNMVKYYMAKDATLYQSIEFLTLFKNPVMFGNYYFDIALFTEHDGDSSHSIDFRVFIRDANKQGLYPNVQTTSIPEATGTGMTRLQIQTNVYPDRHWQDAELFQCQIAYHLGSGSYLLGKEIWVKRDINCKQAPIYVKWINRLGAWSYWLFSGQSEYDANSDEGERFLSNVQDTYSSIKRDVTLYGEASESITVFENDLEYDDKDAWIDFMQQKNVYVLKHKYWGSINDYLISGLNVFFYLDEPHNLKNGDSIRFLYDWVYANTASYTVTVVDDTTFMITTAATPTVPADGMIWRKIASNEDWILHRKSDDQSTIKALNKTFSLNFTLQKPLNYRRLV